MSDNNINSNNSEQNDVVHEGAEVIVEESSGQEVVKANPEQIAAHIHEEPQRPSTSSASEEVIQVEAEVYDGLDIVRSVCNFCKHVEEAGTTVSEKQWQSWIANTRIFKGGIDYIHKFSSEYAPEGGQAPYSEDNTDRAIENSSAPWYCQTIREHGFEGCPENGCKVNCPAELPGNYISSRTKHEQNAQRAQALLNGDSDDEESKESLATTVGKELIAKCDICSDNLDCVFISYGNGVVAVKSKRFERIAKKVAVEISGKTLTENGIKEVQGMLEAESIRNPKLISPAVRKYCLHLFGMGMLIRRNLPHVQLRLKQLKSKLLMKSQLQQMTHRLILMWKDLLWSNRLNWQQKR